VAPTARSISSIFGLGPAWFDTIKHYSRGAWWGENGKIGRLVSMISSGRTRIPTMHCGIALCLRYDVFTGYLQDVDVFLHHWIVMSFLEFVISGRNLWFSAGISWAFLFSFNSPMVNVSLE
jgi:hypothetical protein